MYVEILNTLYLVSFVIFTETDILYLRSPLILGSCYTLLYLSGVFTHYNVILSMLLWIFARVLFMQKSSRNVSSVSCSLCFLYCICNRLFNCAFILSIIVSCGNSLCSYL